jgi:hypothetical protein
VPDGERQETVEVAWVGAAAVLGLGLWHARYMQRRAGSGFRTEAIAGAGIAFLVSRFILFLGLLLKMRITGHFY